MSSVKLRKEKNCLNCGHHVEETYCPNCGQENIELKEDAWHMITHAIADYFHFEHKFFGTLKPLLFKPGKLTVDYVAGKRVSFLHPIKLYIFVSIVAFIMLLGGDKKHKKSESYSTKKPVDTEKLDTATISEIEEVKQIIRYIPIPKAQKDSIIRVAEKDIKEKGSTSFVQIDNSIGGKDIFKRLAATQSSVEEYEKAQLALPKAERDNFIQNYFNKKQIQFNNYENPKEKLKQDIFKFIPKMMFILLPLFALILKLVYLRKKRFYYEHLIYSFHVHSAIFLVIILAKIFNWLTHFVFDMSDWINFFGFIYVVWYIYRSLRTFYGSSRWVTVLKFFFLNFCYSILLVICFIGIIAISFIGG